jgi:two-component system sensor histidine kinase EvgS
MNGPLIDRAVIDELRAMSDDEEDLFADVVTLFVADTPAQLRDLRAALAARDHAAVHRLAHRLKGSARSVGACQVGEIAAAVETASKSGDIDAASAAAATLDDAFAATRVALAREIA